MSLNVMNDRKVQQKTEKLAKKGFFHFVGEVKEEFKRISWTSKEELRVYTKIVIAATFMFGLGVYGIDVVIQGFLSSMNIAIKWITG